MVQELGKGEKRKFAVNHEDECYPTIRSFHNHLFLNSPEGNSNHSENRPTFLTIAEGGF